jgi:hypothetical protein
MTVNRGENNGSLMNPQSFLFADFRTRRAGTSPFEISVLDAVARVLHNEPG